MDLVIRYFKYNVAYATKLRNYGGFKSSFCWFCISLLSDTNLLNFAIFAHFYKICTQSFKNQRKRLFAFDGGDSRSWRSIERNFTYVRVLTLRLQYRVGRVQYTRIANHISCEWALSSFSGDGNSNRAPKVRPFRRSFRGRCASGNGVAMNQRILPDEHLAPAPSHFRYSKRY